MLQGLAQFRFALADFFEQAHILGGSRLLPLQRFGEFLGVVRQSSGLVYPATLLLQHVAVSP